MEQLKKLRIRENLTIKEMSEKLDISESLYQKLEYGVRTPSINVLKKIKNVFPLVDINIFFS